MDIKLKRGNQINFGAITLLEGEPAFVLDNGEFYIGDGAGKTLINPPAPVQTVAGKAGSVILDKTDVGLANVTNESKETILDSAALTGLPTAPTQTAADSSTKIATTEYVKTQGYVTELGSIDGGTF